MEFRLTVQFDSLLSHFCRKPAAAPAREAFASKRPFISVLRFSRRVSNAPFIQSHLGFRDSLYFSLFSFIVRVDSLSSVASAIFSSVSASIPSRDVFFCLEIGQYLSGCSALLLELLL